MALVDARTGRVVTSRSTFTSDVVLGALAARLRVPSWVNPGAYRVYVSCFSYTSAGTRFEPAPLNVVPAAPTARVGAVQVVPAAVPSGVARAVRVVMPSSCGPTTSFRSITGVVQNIANGAVIGQFPFFGSVRPGVPIPATTIVVPANAPAGRYLVDAICFDDTRGTTFRFEPAALAVGLSAPRTAARLTVVPAKVAAGGTIRTSSGCGDGPGSFLTASLSNAVNGEEIPGAATSGSIRVPVTAAPGIYKLTVFCFGIPRLPGTFTVLAPTLVGAARPVTTVSPTSARAGAAVGVAADTRYCKAGPTGFSFPSETVTGVLVDRLTGREVAIRTWGAATRPFFFSTAGARAGSYLLYVSCSDPSQVGASNTFEPVALTLRP